MNDVSNEQLLAEFYRGNISAFDSLWEQLADDLFNFASKLTCHGRQAEDFLQQAWEEILKKPERYLELIEQGDFNLRSYMFKIIHNKFIDEVRKRERSEGTVDIDSLAEVRNLNPNEKAQFKDILEEVEKCLARLKDIYREVFVLVKVAGFTLAEVAEMLGIDYENAKNRRRVAYKHMKICLTKKRGDLHDEISPLIARQEDISFQDFSARYDPFDRTIDALINESKNPAPEIIKLLLYKKL